MPFPCSGYVAKGTEGWARAAFVGGGACTTTCYPDLSWECRDQRIQRLECLRRQLPSGLALSSKTWPNTSTLHAWSCEPHVMRVRAGLVLCQLSILALALCSL